MPDDERYAPGNEKDDTQPKRPPNLPEAPIIPPPPQGPAQPAAPVRRRKKRRRGGWGNALLIAGVLSLLILLVGLILLLLVAPEYIEPYVPGRNVARTATAQAAVSTRDALSTREAALVQTQQQAANNAAATGTAVVEENDRRSTQAALDAQATSSALVQTATGAAVAFDATRTSVALESQSTAAAATLEAVRGIFTQTAVAQQASEANAEATIAALAPVQLATPVQSDRRSDPIATASTSQMGVLFVDDFSGGLRTEWTRIGEWQVAGGAAFADVCGASILVGDPEWESLSVSVTVDNPDAQFAVQFGYGAAGRLFVNFGLDGSVWWLVDGAAPIEDGTLSRVYDSSSPNRVRVDVDDDEVQLYVDGVLITERMLPNTVHGPVGLYTCPNQSGVPRFDDFRVQNLR